MIVASLELTKIICDLLLFHTCRTNRTTDVTVVMMYELSTSPRSAGDKGEGGTSRISITTLDIVSIPAVGEEPEQDQSEEQL